MNNIRFDLMCEDYEEDEFINEHNEEYTFDCGCFVGNDIITILDPENLDKMTNLEMN